MVFRIEAEQKLPYLYQLKSCFDISPETMFPDLDGFAAQHSHTHSQFRSEEHTSELQSLMRISYAVFCLKKKKTQTIKNHTKSHKLVDEHNVHDKQHIH